MAILGGETMKGFSSFPKIFHIGDTYIPNLFKGKVEITEKIDGSQWVIGIDENSNFRYRSKGKEWTNTAIDNMFYEAYTQTLARENILREKFPQPVYLYMEYLKSPKHNVLKYNNIPKNNFALFGAYIKDKFIDNYEHLKEIALLLDIDIVPLLYYGELKGTMEEINKFLETESYLGGCKIEGIVIKNYNQVAMIKNSIIIPISMGKYVSEKFKEKHKTEWKRDFTSKGKLELFIESFRTEARWNKAIQHLKEKGELECSVRDIGKLIQEIKNDLLEEEKENIKNGLYKIFVNDIVRKSTHGFPEWYKEKLVNKEV